MDHAIYEGLPNVKMIMTPILVQNDHDFHPNWANFKKDRHISKS